MISMLGATVRMSMYLSTCESAFFDMVVLLSGAA
jgi:hypothetical protein